MDRREDGGYLHSISARKSRMNTRKEMDPSMRRSTTTWIRSSRTAIEEMPSAGVVCFASSITIAATPQVALV